MLNKVIKVKLVKEEYIDKNLPKGWKPYYIYKIIVDDEVVGKITLREGTREERYYDGHIGYTVEKKYQELAVGEIEKEIYVIKLQVDR